MKRIILLIGILCVSLFSFSQQLSKKQKFNLYSIDSGINPEIPISITGRNNLESFGDSFTVGQNASPSSNSYINRFDAAKIAITTVRNNAVGGRGVYNQVAAAQGLSFTRSTTVFSVMAGLNDIRRGGSNIKTLNKIESAYRGMIIKCINGGSTASGNASIIRTGVINSFAANSVGGAFPAGAIPGNVATNAPAQADGVATWTWTFTGTSFGIQFSGSDGVISTYGNARIYIDGILTQTIALNNIYDGISDGANDNARGPTGYTWHNLTNTLHTIRVESDGSGNVPIDFFCVLLSPANACAIIFFEIPYLNSTGYSIAPNLGSINASNLGSARIRQLVEFYKNVGYLIVYIPTNTYYNLTTGIDADNIHPNNTGHLQIFTGMNAGVL